MTIPMIEGKTASDLNAADAAIDGMRRAIFSDATGEILRLSRCRFTAKPVIYAYNPIYGYWAMVREVPEAWAIAKGLGQRA